MSQMELAKSDCVRTCCLIRMKIKLLSRVSCCAPLEHWDVHISLKLICTDLRDTGTRRILTGRCQ